MQFFTDLFYIGIQLINDVFSAIVSFIAIIPDLFEYLYVTGLRMYVEGKIIGFEIAFEVARSVLVDYEVYTFISNQFNKLPNDLAYSAHALGVVDGMRIVVDALATAFVLRVAGW
ncbi:hypothetical protein TUM4438_23440 [Shewanella sairae]|uniref:DUF2523 domain-containing protein n=1 Tax=Shewanella sairae TaxID=190310 RepID=A0ABQ4PGQ5_9GAMM|nr:hypothetical protein [Shewanella sairae]MCL1132500.1 hypothetical protein [Shewanella sairae]GIU46740.1 hypothetical protein TUM4438_23360 [Shewanella sairae]GIU46757.1 hypothetical protein TUM4438_23440 [Shewanella sairae]